MTKLNYERERARKEVSKELNKARQMKEDSDVLTTMLFLGCAFSHKSPAEMADLYRSCRGYALILAEEDGESRD